jgi:ParB-like chromosome segregation protein Spo0J
MGMNSQLKTLEVNCLSLCQLRGGFNIRQTGLDEAHVMSLASVPDAWPPVLVSAADYMVIDGAHRVEAARRLGFTSISVTLFDGTPDEAFLEFLRRNISHGLPLTLRERELAGKRILQEHPEWSDRRIATSCALAAKTIAKLRCRLSAEIPNLKSRIGIDGVARPVHIDEMRKRIVASIEAHPEASLRSIARDAGASPEAVRNARKALERDPVKRSSDRAWSISSSTAGECTQAPTSSNGQISKDEAFFSREESAQFVKWFETTTIAEDDWRSLLTAVPLSRVYQIADEARRRGQNWLEFASSLENRTRRR